MMKNYCILGILVLALVSTERAVNADPTFLGGVPISVTAHAGGPNPSSQLAANGHLSTSDPTAYLKEDGTTYTTADNSLVFVGDFSSIPYDAKFTIVIINTGHENWSGTGSSTRTYYPVDYTYTIDYNNDTLPTAAPQRYELGLSLGSVTRFDSQSFWFGISGTKTVEWAHNLFRPNHNPEEFIAVITTAGLDTDCDLDDVSIQISYWYDYGADFDCDGDVDSVDLLVMYAEWTGAGTHTKRPHEGDLDWDGDVDSADWLIFASQWTSEGEPEPPPGYEE